MRKVIIFDEEEYRNLRWKIVQSILLYSKKSYGFKMVSRDTKKELEDDAVRGMLLSTIDKILEMED
jgi:hypothetical protein